MSVSRTANETITERNVLDKALAGERLTAREGLFLWQEGDFRNMGTVAHELRNRRHNSAEVSFTAFRVVNYTNYCNVECSFCSFMDEVSSDKGYTLGIETILQKLDEAVAQDAPQLFLQGGVNPKLPFNYYVDVLAAVKEKFPQVHTRAFSPVEALFMEKSTGLSLEQVFEKLKQAGMKSFPGAGAEILSDRVRDILSPLKASVSDWLRAMRIAGQSGLPGSTNIVWGSEETDEEIIAHLTALRDLQDQTGKVLSFVPWTFQAQTKKFKIRKVPPHEYLKMVALSRIYLDNIDNIEVSIMVAGKQSGEIALYFGANDINSPVIEENVLRSFGLKTVKESEQFIAEAGFTPVRRNFNFEKNKKF